MIDCQLCETCPFVEGQKELYYEIHITVEYSDNFVTDCYELGLKPIIIDMGDNIPPHSMTSSSIKGGSDDMIYATALNQADLFKSKGYIVTRIKIETVPWHPKALNRNNDQYFETHFAIKFPYNSERLKLWSANLGLHYSRNKLKRDNYLVQMLTYRTYENLEKYEKNVNRIKKLLTEDGFEIDKVINEFALYDTNIELDDLWLKSTYQSQSLKAS